MAKLSDKARVVAIAILMLLSVFVDSIYYVISAFTDGLFMAAVIFLAWPLVKKIW
ncbi:hypothetical protein [Pantoea phage Nafs113]|nr:hypothetical protein [Pantoea phage Nafs113]